MSTTPTAAHNGADSASSSNVPTGAEARPARVYSPVPIPPSYGKVLARYDSESRIYGFAGMAVQFPRNGESCMFFTSPKEFGDALKEGREPRLLVSKREYFRLQPFAIHSHKWVNVLESLTVGGFWGVLSMYIDPDKRPKIEEEMIFDDWRTPRQMVPVRRHEGYDPFSEGLVMAPDAYDVAVASATPWSLVRELSFNLRVIRKDHWDSRIGKLIESPFKDDGRRINGIEELYRTERTPRSANARAGAFFGGHQAPPPVKRNGNLAAAFEGIPQATLMAAVRARQPEVVKE